MNDMPNDIMKAAEEAFDKTLQAEFQALDRSFVVSAIASAIMAERERCATIAKNESLFQEGLGKAHQENSAYRDRCFARARTALDMEQAILKGEQQ